MPPGTMNTRIIKERCQGYSCDTIEITYSFRSGKLPDGQHYSGTTRYAYLPNNEEGKELLKLLKKAFDKKFSFVVGTSLTTGAQNTVVWAIHHKTDLYPGPYGYPDSGYFTRIKQDLKAKGIE